MPEKFEKPTIEQIEEKEKEERIERRRAEVIERFYPKEKYLIDSETLQEIDAFLLHKTRDLAVDAGRSWIKEHLDEFLGVTEREVDKFESEKILELLKEKKEFWKQLDEENREWRKLDLLRKTIEEQGGEIDQNIKMWILKELPRGDETKEKVWEKIEGKDLAGEAKKAAKIGELEDYIEKTKKERYLPREWKRRWREVLRSQERERYQNIAEKEGKTPEEIYQRERIEELKDKYFSKLRFSINRGALTNEMIYALLAEGITPEKIIRWFPGRVKFRKNREWETMSAKAFLEKTKSKITEITENLEREWQEKFKNKKIELVENTARKTPKEATEELYNRLEKERLLSSLEREIKRDPKKKAEMEKRLGKEKIDIIGLFKEAMDLDDLGKIRKEDLVEDSEVLLNYFGRWGLMNEDLEKILTNPDAVDPEIRRSYSETVQKKYGILDWIIWVITSFLETAQAKRRRAR